MAVPTRIPVRTEDVFPLGVFVISVEPLNDYEKTLAKAADPQERDKDTGMRLWQVRVMDGDPNARTSEVKIKVAVDVQPVPPPALPGTPFRPVEFDGLTVTPYVDSQRCNGRSDRCRARNAYSLRATAMRPVQARRTNTAAA